MKPTPVADYFKDPAHHTKNYVARDAEGNPVCEDNESATCRCLSGEIMFLHPSNYAFRAPLYEALEKIITKKFPERISDADCSVDVVTHFNDHPLTTPQEVYEVCVEAQV